MLAKEVLDTKFYHHSADAADMRVDLYLDSAQHYSACDMWTTTWSADYSERYSATGSRPSVAPLEWRQRTTAAGSARVVTAGGAGGRWRRQRYIRMPMTYRIGLLNLVYV